MRLERSEIYAAVGWTVPSLKGLATGERAIANWDEDAITMGFEAAQVAYPLFKNHLLKSLEQHFLLRTGVIVGSFVVH